MRPPYWNRLKSYNINKVQTIWEDSIDHDLTLDDPFYSNSHDDYVSRVKKADQLIKRAKKSGPGIGFNRQSFRKASYREQKILDSSFRFEYRMANIDHSVCASCFESRIGMRTTSKESICNKCQDKSRKSAYNSVNTMLPTWTDENGVTQYHVPSELEGLSIAEILLIQRVSPLVPLVHIKNGTLGIKGHVCSFLQDVNEVATRLPKLPSEVKAVKMIRSYKGNSGVDNVKVFVVNRDRVMRALFWLTRHHRDYKKAYERGELKIDPSNLDWMNGESESTLPSIVLRRECESQTELDKDENAGVSNCQCADPDTNNDEFDTSGISCPENAALSSEANDQIIRSLKSAAEEGKTKIPALDWPQQTSDAISEFDGSIRIFVNAFPHLFPGGIGDATEDNRKVKVTIGKWAQHMLLYTDGRFARDPVWCFFAYNYCLRHRNKESGSIFVNSVISRPPLSLEELQTSLRNGDSSFVNKMAFYTKRIRGSDAYWRHKRAELYNWIHYHLGEGHGAPNGFFTLSCAEYFWPDMIRLLEDRIWIAEGRHRNGPGAKTDRYGNLIDLANDRKARNKAVNDYAIVIQEFFIHRTEDYLNTIGKEILGIEHYWLRFEFAKGRGQIHAHILVILKKILQNRIQEQVDAARGNREKEAQAVSKWAEKQFGMTAKFDENVAEDESE